MAKENDSGMKKVAAFIVDKRNLFFLIYAVALVFSLFSRNWVEVENDITTYLPDDTETRQGLTVMNDNFVTYGSARVMLSNVTQERAQNIADDLLEVEGVSRVTFDDTEDHYRSASALLDVSFDAEETDERAITAMHTIEDMLAPYDCYIDTAVGVDSSAELASEMGVIVLLAAVIIVIVLTLTSKAYMEVPVLIMTFGAAALLNMGTNFLCGKISFISNSVTVVLQLALAIDYAIILCHRFSAEHETKGTREACIDALSKAIPEISSSSLTTISGLAALAFMHFGIGLDMAIVLIKAILLSLLSVFTLMPGLLMLFSNLIDRTHHKNLVPKITAIGKFDVATRFVIPPVFVALTIVACIFANRCPYVYTYNDLTTAKQSEKQVAVQKIKRTFGSSNTVAIIVPSGDYEKESQILTKLQAEPSVKSTMGLASIEAMDGYVLTDALTPRQFSELVGLDYEAAKLLYTAYATDKSQYGELLNGVGAYKVPLFDMFLFLEEQMHNGNITLEGDTQQTLDDLFDTAAALCGAPGRRYVYTYWGEPDHTMHDQGVMAVRDMVRDIDDRVRAFCQAMDEDTLVLVTADHGLLDCEYKYTCDYPELEQALVRPFHIEARAAGFYVKPEYREVFPQLFDAAFGCDDFWLVSTDAALSMGLFGGGTPRADIREIIGDYIAIATGRYSLAHSREDTALTAMHAGMTAREMYVPLIAAKT